MAEASQRDPPRYRRLPGRWYGVATKASVWLSPDHLLVVERAWFVEHYWRLRLRDIESVVLQRTRAREIGAATAALVLAAGLALAPWPPAGFELRTAMGGLAVAIGAMALVMELARGAGCAATVRTRTTSVCVRAWSRRRAARRGMEQLCPAIAAVQPPLTAEQLAAERGTEADPEPVQPRPPALPPVAPPRAWAGTVAALLAVEGAVAAGALALEKIAFAFAPLAVTAILILIGAVNILVNSMGRQAAELRQWAVAVIVYWGARGVAMYAIWVVAGWREFGQGDDPAPWLGIWSWRSADVAVQALLGAIAAVSVLMAVLGGLVVHRAK